jgi:integrase
MANPIKLTDAFIRSRECPENQPSVSYRDTGGNLYLWVSRKSKSFRYRYRFKGRATKELTLGRWPDMSVQKARELAASYDRARSEGRDPQHLNVRVRDVLTVADILDHHLEGKSGESRRTISALYKDLRAAHGATTLLDFTSPLLRDWMLQEYPHRPGSARTLIKNLAGAFSKAMDPRSGLRFPVGFLNPASGLASHLPFLSLPENRPGTYATAYEEDEMRSLLQAMSSAYGKPGVSDVVVGALELMLLTGARPSEITSLRWDELEQASGGWVIVKNRHKTWLKTGRPRRILVMGDALKVLERAKKAQAGKESPFVFPSNVERKGQITHHIVYLAPTCKRISEIAGIKFVPYNFRSAYINFALDILGFEQIEIVAENVGHTDVRTTMTFYRKLRDAKLFSGAARVADAFSRLQAA